MIRKLLSLLLFVSVVASSAAQYTPPNWTLVIYSTGRYVDGGYYTASACVGYAQTGGILANPSNPFSYYVCDNYNYTTNVMGCRSPLVFDPHELMCNFRELVDQSYWPNFPWDDYKD